MSDVFSALRGMQALDGMHEEHIQRLATIAENIAFPSGAILFREGDPANRSGRCFPGSVENSCGNDVSPARP